MKWDLVMATRFFLFVLVFFNGEGPCSRRYGRTAAMRLIVQPYDEDEDYFLSFFLGIEHRWKNTEELGGKTCPSATLSTTKSHRD
jgi:hypothetical protein